MIYNSYNVVFSDIHTCVLLFISRLKSDYVAKIVWLLLGRTDRKDNSVIRIECQCLNESRYIAFVIKALVIEKCYKYLLILVSIIFHTSHYVPALYQRAIGFSRKFLEKLSLRELHRAAVF